MLEIFSLGYLFLNSFFAQHIVLISHMFGAVFLVLTETSVNMRIISPILDWMESMFLGNIPFIPSLVSAAIFIVWATFSIFLYQMMFQWILRTYQDQITLAIAIIFILVTVGMNMKYRD